MERFSSDEKRENSATAFAGTVRRASVRNMIAVIKRYLRLLGVFAKFSLMSQLEYRANFVAGVCVETGWMLIKLLYVAVVYRAGISIGVLTPDHILLFIGIYVLMTGFYMLYYGNFTSLSTKVREGQLDMYLVKPVSTQFLVTLRQLDFSLLLPDLVVGIVMIGIGWSRAGLPLNVGSVAGFLFLLACSNLLTYSMFLIPNLLCFWIVSTRGISDMTAALWDFNNMPQMIYGKWMQRIGTFILPIFVITNFPGLFLMGELSKGMMVWAVVVPILFFVIARLIWKRAVKSYTSASS